MALTKIPLSKITNQDFSWAIMQLSSATVPAKAAYWISKIFRKVESQQKHFDTALRKTLEKYAKTSTAPDGSKVVDRDEQTKEPIWLQADSKDLFETEIKELQKEEIELPTIKFSLLGDDAKLPTNALLLLEDIVIIEEDKQ
jgi:hypothetical protein